MNSNTYDHNNINIYLLIFYFIVDCVALWVHEIEREAINTLNL